MIVRRSMILAGILALLAWADGVAQTSQPATQPAAQPAKEGATEPATGTATRPGGQPAPATRPAIRPAQGSQPAGTASSPAEDAPQEGAPTGDARPGTPAPQPGSAAPAAPTGQSSTSPSPTGASPTGPSPTSPSPTGLSAGTPTLAEPGLADETTPPGAPYGRYVLQPSDTIAINYRYTPEFDFTGPVQPDGFISPPLIGEVMVAGLTLEQARERILAKATQRLRDPEVFVVLKDFQKPSFAVAGEVGSPGQFELRGRTGVLEAIAIAGGFKQSAKHSEVVLFRRYDDEHVITRVINVKDLARRSKPQPNIELQAGDFLLVPQSKLSKLERVMPLANLLILNRLIWR